MSHAADPRPFIVPLEDLSATEALAGRLAELARAGDIIGLAGELGVGKTAFARAFIRARLGEVDVPSPTFTLVQVYDNGETPVWHVDLYRLKDAEEMFELGVEDAFDTAICLIEWPEKMAGHDREDWLELRLTPGDTENARRAAFTPHGARAARLVQLLAG